MVDIDVKGPIINNSEEWIYNFFGEDCTSATRIASELKNANGDDVTVNINSCGGDMFTASEIFQLLNNYDGNVTIKIVGIAASAASVIACAGYSEIAPTALMMIHNVSSGLYGDNRDHQHEAEVLKKCNKSISNAYRLKTGMAESELLALMNKETWLTAEEAVEKGFCDKIIENKQNSNNANLSFVASVGGMIAPTKIAKMQKKKKENQLKIELLNLKQRKEIKNDI